MYNEENARKFHHLTYRLDKTIAKAQTFKEADNQLEYWQSKTIKERLSASWYLTCQAFGLKYLIVHRLDRAVHSMRKHNDS